jgi:signal transduction histidine kinase
MSPIDPASPTEVSRATEPTFFTGQVLLSIVTIAASAAGFVDHWIASGDIWAWNALTGATAIIVLFCVLANARNRRALRRHLADANVRLRAAAASATVGDEALRLSELSHASSEQSLSESIALGQVGEDKLRIAVAKGIEGDARLHDAVESGLVGDEALRVSVEAGLVGDEALRVSVEAGLVGDEALRVSVARGVEVDAQLHDAVQSGLVGDEALRVSVARGVEVDAQLHDAVESGLVGDEALRVSLEAGRVGDEALRVSVEAGLVGDEALRVSIARGVQSAEALRLSVEQGIDAAITTLAVVDSVDAAITLYAPDGHILLTNDTARTLAVLARSGELDPHEFAHDRVTLIPRFDQVLARAARGQLVTRRAYWVGTGEAQRAIMSTSQYVKRASGELIGTVVASHDVTPLARTRDEFLETVSHELRTPLTSMIGYLELIEDSLDLNESGIALEFETVKRNTDRLLLLINDLLLTAQGDPPAYREPADVVAVARRSFDALSRQAAQANVELIIEDAQPLIAEIDAGLIGEVFDKVLSNALKFNQPGGRVEIAFRTDPRLAIISIADTGVGISEDDQKRIFERFYRAPSTRADLTAGVGLGLSAAKLIVDAHHGSITAISSPGTGTTIEISLPLVYDESSPELRAPAADTLVVPALPQPN